MPLTMVNGLTTLSGLCALGLLLAGCSSDGDPAASSSDGGSGSVAGESTGGRAGASVAAGGSAGHSGTAASAGHHTGGSATAGGSATGGESSAAGAAGKTSGDGAPPAVDGKSVYALECHGDSKDCALGTVPCFGVGSSTPDVAAGWACANRCETSAECSDAPSGAEAQASCVSFTSSGHCVLVCQNEARTFSCPAGMTCYTPPKSPIGYCLWQ